MIKEGEIVRWGWTKYKVLKIYKYNDMDVADIQDLTAILPGGAFKYTGVAVSQLRKTYPWWKIWRLLW